jgi:hypothetical protein
MVRVCKTVIAGSNPADASKNKSILDLFCFKNLGLKDPVLAPDRAWYTGLFGPEQLSKLDRER